MGIPAQHLTMPRPRTQTRRRGVALPSVLFALVVLSILGIGIHVLGDIQGIAQRNRDAAAKALMLAEEGAVHALAIVRDTLGKRSYNNLLAGSDNALNTTDDGRLIGYGMSSSLIIPVAGRSAQGGIYSVEMMDDPADADGNPKTDANGKILLRCRAAFPDSATATVDVIIGATVYPAMAAEGNLQISGSPTVKGACGSVHANEIAIVSGTPVVAGRLSASDTVQGTQTYQDTLGVSRPALHNQPPMDLPDFNPMDHCGSADYLLRSDGWILRKSDNTLHNALAIAQFGWKMSSLVPVVWELSGPSAVPGAVCAQGNIKINGNTGSAAAPIPMSLIASGSVEVSGNPYIVPANGDSIAIMAGGDVSISGNPSSATDRNYDGLIYSASQCKISGNPNLNSQVLCKNKPNPAGSVNLADKNEISGNPNITYGCGGMLGRRRIHSWYQRTQ